MQLPSSLFLIALIAAFILLGPIYSVEPSVILYNPEGIIHKVLIPNMESSILGSSDLPIIGENR
jgi:hypothetical protein